MRRITFLFGAILILCVIALWYATIMYRQGVEHDCANIVALDRRLKQVEGKQPGNYVAQYEDCVAHYPI